MLQVNLLGVGGTMPLPGRALTALLLRCNGRSILIDCGEGAQVSLREMGLSARPIDAILFTHYHGDHVTGLPGLLLTMAKEDRREPVRLFGPAGLRRVVSGLCVVAPGLPFRLEGGELSGEVRFSLGPLQVDAFPVSHTVPCYGYAITLPRAPRFDPERARAAGIPQKYWNRLQHGETIEECGAVYTPDMVLGPPRRGLKVTYCTDTRPVANIVRLGRDSDLFVCEGMYGDEEKLPKARENRHMLFREAAELARDMNARELWLTHYSPSLTDPQAFLGAARSIFPGAVAPKGGVQVELGFRD